MKVLHLDSNHSLLLTALEKLNINNHCDFSSSKNTIENIIGEFHGIVIRQHSGQISNNEGADPNLMYQPSA